MFSRHAMEKDYSRQLVRPGAALKILGRIVHQVHVPIIVSAVNYADAPFDRNPGQSQDKRPDAPLKTTRRDLPQRTPEGAS